MSKKNDCWGIEVGSYAIKAIRLVRSGDKITVADFDVLPFKQILTTPDLNVDEAIQLNLDQFLSKRSVSRSSIAVSVPGNAAFARFAKLPPVEPKRIPDIVKFEAVQQIPFPIDQVEWDYQVFSKPDSPDVEVGIFAITRERVNQYLANYRAVGLEVDIVTLSPLAVFNAMSYDMALDEDSPGVIFMDMGTTSTDVIIVEEGNLWLRTLPKGGNNFTESLVRAFKLSYSKAEKLKREAGTSKYSRQIFQAMRPVFADLVQEMQRSLGYYQSLNRDTELTRLVGIGSTFRLPGMQKFLKQQLQMEVTRPDGFARLEVDNKIASEFSEHALNMVTACGLALQGLGLAKVEANVMPIAVLKQRNWRSKQPWMAATAAMFVAASSAAYVKYWSETQKAQTHQAEVSATAGRVVNQAKTLVEEFNAIESSGADPRQKLDNLRRLLDYRDLWPKIIYDLDQASQSLASQPALLTADYDAILKIPREQRRRVYIDKVTAEYQFASEAEAGITSAAAPPRRSAAQSFEDMWGPGAMDAPPDMGMGGDPGGEPNADRFDPPAFRITIEGTTPYREGPRLVIEHFIHWFRTHGELAGRPYTILQKSVVSGPMSQIGGPLSAGGMTGQQQPATPPPGGRSGRFRPPADPYGQQSPGAGVSESIFPVWPLAQESNANDWRFSCTFVVKLVSPEDARKAERRDMDQTQSAAPAATEAQP